MWIWRMHWKFVRKVFYGCLFLVMAWKISLDKSQLLFAFAPNRTFCCSYWNHLDLASPSSCLVPKRFYIPSSLCLSWKHNPSLAALWQKSALWKTVPWFVWEEQMGTEGCRHEQNRVEIQPWDSKVSLREGIWDLGHMNYFRMTLVPSPFLWCSSDVQLCAYLLGHIDLSKLPELKCFSFI